MNRGIDRTWNFERHRTPPSWKFGTVLIDCSQQQIRLAAQRHKHFVQMPCGAGVATRSFHAMREARAELVYMNGPLCARLSCASINRMGCSSTFGLFAVCFAAGLYDIRSFTPYSHHEIVRLRQVLRLGGW
jgi:hypothetical protein